MMDFSWNESLQIGVDKLDDQHKEIFTRIDALFDAVRKGTGQQEVENTIAFLDEYVSMHFSEEEVFMKGIAFPDYEAHIAVHDIFRKEFEAFKVELADKGMGDDLVSVIKKKVFDWLWNHIAKMDKKIGDYING